MPRYTKADFLESRKPYEHIFSLKKQPLLHKHALEAVQKNAHAVGVRNFNKMYAAYETQAENLIEVKDVP